MGLERERRGEWPALGRGEWPTWGGVGRRGRLAAAWGGGVRRQGREGEGRERKREREGKRVGNFFVLILILIFLLKRVFWGLWGFNGIILL